MCIFFQHSNGFRAGQDTTTTSVLGRFLCWSWVYKKLCQWWSCRYTWPLYRRIVIMWSILTVVKYCNRLCLSSFIWMSTFLNVVTTAIYCYVYETFSLSTAALCSINNICSGVLIILFTVWNKLTSIINLFSYDIIFFTFRINGTVVFLLALTVFWLGAKFQLLCTACLRLAGWTRSCLRTGFYIIF